VTAKEFERGKNKKRCAEENKSKPLSLRAAMPAKKRSDGAESVIKNKN
jgi:hypothetical protein